MKEIVIGKNDSGQRLDRFIEKALPLLPGSLRQKYIRIKRIKVNGRPSKREYRLREGDKLSLYINDEFFGTFGKENPYLEIENPELTIIYEDDNILLTDKKPGMLAHADKSSFQNTLIDNIQAYLYQSGRWLPEAENSFTPSLCNRIDRNTGGIVIAAKTASALRIINEKIKNRELDKYYICIVHGVPSPTSGTLEGYTFKDSAKNRVHVVNQPKRGAKAAATQYETLAERDGLSLVRCRLLTGRSHQIRAQFSAAGHPLLGDTKYGAPKGNERYQALYSYKLVFAFSSPANELEYLKDMSFSVSSINFVEKYFDSSYLH